jgi:serine/threonine protein kinase
LKVPARYLPSTTTFSGGGMSDAKLYTDTHLERLVVIKSLKDGTDQKRILDELAALQSIRSKHVVQVYDIIRDDAGAVAAIIEEYIPGADLSSAAAPKDAIEFLKGTSKNSRLSQFVRI